MSDCYENSQVLPTFENQSNYRITPCPQLPGTVFRVFIPAGAVINLLNLIEVASPSGICLIVRVPLLAGIGGNDGRSVSLTDLQAAVANVGGSVEVM